MGARPAVHDVGENDFERDVLERSEELPVVVDFWAPWCGPCRALGPVLERLIGGDFAGRIALATVNTDDNTGLARDFDVRGIPAVKVFRNRGVVAEFVGALPEAEVRRFLEAVLPTRAELLAREGAELEAVDPQAAADRYLAALTEDRLQPLANLGLGRLREAGGRHPEALEHYRRVLGGAEEKEAQRRAAEVEIKLAAAASAGEPRWRSRLERDPRDVEARYELGLLLAAGGDHRGALEQLLEAVRLDREFRDQAARKAMLRVFEVVGPRSELADEFRARLATALY